MKANTVIYTIYLFVSIIIFIIGFYYPSFTRKKFIFGINIKKDNIKTIDNTSILVSYRISYLTTSILIYIILFLLKNILSLKIFIIVSLILYIINIYLNYIYHHLQFKNKIKKQCHLPMKNNEVSKVDISIPKYNNKLFYIIISFVFISINIIIGYFQYPNLPNIVPIHYNSSGIANNFVNKTYLLIFYLPLTQLCFDIFISYIYIISNKKTIKIKLINNYIFFLLINLLFISLNLCILKIISFSKFNIILLVLAILLLISAGYNYYIAHKKSLYYINPNTYNDKNEVWLLGIFYFNKNDKSILTPKRTGVGFSLNFANPFSWFIVIIISIFILYCIFYN